MGTVYLARDTRLGRLAAVKLLRKRGELADRRLLSEARATARCRHENIVIIYEVGEHRGAPYMALEYVEGQTLRSWMRRRARARAPETGEHDARAGRASTEQAVERMVPVVRALACAHAQGIVHRDLKPENILLSGAGLVKVADFGIAKQLRLGPPARPAPRAGLRAKSSLQGTLLYMAPEQRRGEPLDARADLWAVGLVLYELCAGEHAFTPESFPQIVDLDAASPSLREKRPDTAALADVVDRCLKKRRDERFASADELLAALEALGADRDAPGADREAPQPGREANPFTGLAPFQEEDAARFFGRTPDVGSALAALRNHPLLAVVGASGAGKSSFMRAGVLTALKRADEPWETLVVRPGRRPLAALAELLARPARAAPAGEAERAPGADLAALVWRADGTGEPVVLRGHAGVVWSAAFSPDGRRVVTTSEDKTVRIWNADGAGEPLILRGHQGQVQMAAFSPDGRRVVSAADVDKKNDAVWVWSELEPLRGVDDPKLWAATTYCLPADRRVALLNTPEDQARADEEACRRRVGARATPAASAKAP